MVKHILVNDPREIFGIYSENEKWQIVINSNNVDKIKAYLESDCSVWLAIYRWGNDIPNQRVNARYIESVVYKE